MVEYQPEGVDGGMSDDDVFPQRLPERLSTLDEVCAFMVIEGTVSVGVSGTPSPARTRLSSSVSHLSPGPATPPLPNFGGTWKMKHCFGDFDAFMKEMGVGWALRKAAAAVGYGVNATFHTIKQDGATFCCETKNPKGIFMRTFVINGEEQDDVDPVNKKPLTVIPSWDGTAIHIECRVKDGDDMPVTRRYLEGETMVVEQTTPKGISVKRLFEKA